jgi:hypothetical protein
MAEAKATRWRRAVVVFMTGRYNLLPEEAVTGRGEVNNITAL